MDPEARFHVWKQGFDKKIEQDGDGIAADTESRGRKTIGAATLSKANTTTVIKIESNEDRQDHDSADTRSLKKLEIDTWLNGLQVDPPPVPEPSPSASSNDPRQRKSSSSSSGKGESDMTSVLWEAMMMMEKFRKGLNLNEDQFFYEDGKLRKLFMPVTDEGYSMLRAAAKDRQEYEEAKEMFNKWYKISYDAAWLSNRRSRNIAEVIRGLCDARFGSLGDKFDYSWTESCYSRDDIQKKFMTDCPLEMKLIKGLGKPWGEYYRQQKLAKAEEVFECVTFVSQYETRMNQFLNKKLCVDTEKLDCEGAGILELESMKIPTGASNEKLKAIIIDLNIRFSKIVTKNITLEITNVQKAIQYACTKYQGLMGAKTSDFVDHVELQRLHEKVYAKIVNAFKSVPGFDYTDIWQWPEEQPEPVTMFYAKLQKSNEVKSQPRNVEQLTALLNTMDSQEKIKFLKDHCPELVQTLGPTDSQMESETISNDFIRIKTKREIKIEAAANTYDHQSSPTSYTPPATPNPASNDEDQVSLEQAEEVDEIEFLEEIATPNVYKKGISLHFSKHEILVRWNYEDSEGFPETKKLGPYPSFMTLSKNGQGKDILIWRAKEGLQICPSDLISDHNLVTTGRHELWSHGNCPDSNQDLFAEELLALILKKIITDIREEFKVEPLDASVAVTVPAMAHPACRQRLKTALQLAGLKNSVIVHTSTAIALSYRKYGPQNAGYKAITMYIRAGLVEVAAFYIMGDHVQMIAVRTLSAIPRIFSTSVPQITSDIANLTRRMLQGANIEMADIYACFVVTEPSTVHAKQIVKVLQSELGSNIKLFKKKPAAGIIPGLSDLSIQRLPQKMFNEVFPCSIQLDYGTGRNNHHLAHVFDKAVCRSIKIPASNISACFKVYQVDFEKNQTLCFSVNNIQRIRDLWTNPFVTVQVSSEGLVTLKPEIGSSPGAGLINFNMPTDAKSIQKSQQRLKRILIIESKFSLKTLKPIRQRFPSKLPDGYEPDAKRVKLGSPCF